MKARSLVTMFIFLTAVLGFMSLGAHASTDSTQNTSVSFTVTTTSNYQVTTGGVLQVMFNSVQLTNPPPTAYSFGVDAKTFQGNWITRLIWQFGDGSTLDVPYCCRNEVSEVQYHAYTQQGSYTVIVIALDNAGNYGSAVTTVNWLTPIPEYPVYTLPLIASLIVALLGVTAIPKRLKH